MLATPLSITLTLRYTIIVCLHSTVAVYWIFFCAPLGFEDVDHSSKANDGYQVIADPALHKRMVVCVLWKDVDPVDSVLVNFVFSDKKRYYKFDLITILVR